MKLFIFFLCFFISQAFSAGPMTHLYFAEKWMQFYPVFTEEEKCNFILGNLFPDIRYITDISRKQTHPKVSSMDEVLMCSTPFETGVKLHAFIDEVREIFVENMDIYPHVLPYAEGHPATLLKFIEEEILAECFDGRSYSYCFDVIVKEELVFGLKENTIDNWHEIIRYSMHMKPSWLLWVASGKGMLGISKKTLYNWSYLLPYLAQQPIFRDYMEQLLLHLESVVSRESGISPD